jgi:hypothetical protein
MLGGLINTFRWGAVPLAAILGWLVAMFAGLFTADLVEQWCPLGTLVDGYCVGSTWPHEAVVLFFIGLSAVLSLVFGFFTPPERTPLIAWVLLLVGTGIAFELVRWGQDWGRFVAAVGPGLATATVLTLKYGRPPNRQ